jgi:NAD(P)-dependent dehydrogenase (short-subunit alcohol dehydrogenase family)
MLPKPFRALILGSSGTIGSALLHLLQNDPDCERVTGLHRHSAPAIDYDHLDTIELAYEALKTEQPYHLIINTIGALHSNQFMPEKRLADLHSSQLTQQFLTNAIGPALSIKQFSQLIDPAGGVYATLSAKVGSIADNRLGGWYSYRASKAALNMLIKTAAIELKRTKPNLILAAIHPGTVKSSLSRPFRGDELGREPHHAAQEILSVLKNLVPADSGTFKSYSGEVIPW